MNEFDIICCSFEVSCARPGSCAVWQVLHVASESVIMSQQHRLESFCRHCCAAADLLQQNNLALSRNHSLFCVVSNIRSIRKTWYKLEVLALETGKMLNIHAEMGYALYIRP